MTQSANWPSKRRRLTATQAGRCAHCDRAYEHMQIDHIIPRSAGGSHGIENLQLLCEKCHRRKNTAPDPKKRGAIRPNDISRADFLAWAKAFSLDRATIEEVVAASYRHKVPIALDSISTVVLL